MAMLPILIVLFIFSYGILTTLVFEQAKTVESQRSLIKEMLKDSAQLAELKAKLAQQESLLQRQKSAAGARPSAPTTQQGDPGVSTDTKRADNPRHSTKQTPGKPASDLEDVRRTTKVI